MHIHTSPQQNTSSEIPVFIFWLLLILIVMIIVQRFLLSRPGIFLVMFPSNGVKWFLVHLTLSQLNSFGHI